MTDADTVLLDSVEIVLGEFLAVAEHTDQEHEELTYSIASMVIDANYSDLQLLEDCPSEDEVVAGHLVEAAQKQIEHVLWHCDPQEMASLIDDEDYKEIARQVIEAACELLDRINPPE